MTMLSCERGMVSFKVLFVLFILFLIIHVGVLIIPMYMDAERMKDEMATKAGLAQQLKDEDIVMELAYKAKELDLPLKQEHFKLKRDDENRRMKISTAWDVEVHFLFDLYPPLTVRTFTFAPDIEEDYARKF